MPTCPLRRSFNVRFMLFSLTQGGALNVLILYGSGLQLGPIVTATGRGMLP